jgi:hypothetical protein
VTPITLTAGQVVSVFIELRGLQNQRARAPKDYWIYVEVRDKSQAFWMTSVLVNTGRDSARVAIRIDRVGVFLIKASHAELREGAIWVNVRPKPTVTMPGPPGASPHRLIAFALQPLHASGASDGLVEVTIRSSAQGSKLYADGLEAAVIQAFVTAGQPRSDITLTFLPSRCVLSPNPLVIHPSDGLGAEGHLTSKEHGSATLALVSIKADDNVRVTDKEWERPVQFLQPIKTAHLTLIELPPRALNDPPEDISVELLSLEDQSVTPDEDVKVTLVVNGSGHIDPNPVTITPKEPQKTVQFIPRQRGRITIVATPFGAAQSDPITIDVVMPWFALFVVSICGFAGGLGALLGKRQKGRWLALQRGLLGIITALIVYWAIQNGVSHISGATIGNTLSAGLTGLAAGFMGTKGIDFVLGQVGKTGR